MIWVQVRFRNTSQYHTTLERNLRINKRTKVCNMMIETKATR